MISDPKNPLKIPDVGEMFDIFPAQKGSIYAYGDQISHWSLYMNCINKNGTIKEDCLEWLPEILEDHYKIQRDLYNYSQKQCVGSENYYFTYRFSEMDLSTIMNDRYIIQPIPFSTTFNHEFAIRWGKNKPCCMFIIKVPFDYPVFYLADPKDNSPSFINHTQYEITLPPSVISITNSFEFEGKTIVIGCIKNQIPLEMLLSYVKHNPSIDDKS